MDDVSVTEVDALIKDAERRLKGLEATKEGLERSIVQELYHIERLYNFKNQEKKDD